MSPLGLANVFATINNNIVACHKILFEDMNEVLSHNFTASKDF